MYILLRSGAIGAGDAQPKDAAVHGPPGKVRGAAQRRPDETRSGCTHRRECQEVR